jgi:hypothetical protein
LSESGLTHAEQRRYAIGGNELVVYLDQLRDPSSAYEVHTYSLEPGMIPAHAGQASAANRDHAIVLVGNLAVSVSALNGVSPDDLRALVQTLEPKASPAPMPPIPYYLPLEGRASGTERYALGPAAFRAAVAALDRRDFAVLTGQMGFSSGAEAMLARYRSGKEDAVLLLIEYPTPQLAEQHLRHLEQALPANAKQSGTNIERKASLLSMVLSPSSAAYAQSLRNAVNYETQVTWNEPTHAVTDEPWTTVLSKIFIGTGVFLVVAVVLGVAFGGLRILIKKLFPGKVFDRPEQMQILQLGLSGKPIDSSDFY